MSLDRIKKLASAKNAPIMENVRSDHAFINQHIIVNHKALSAPTADDSMFKAVDIEKGSGHRHSTDQTAPTSDAADINPVNLPPQTDADDAKANVPLAQMFHSLNIRRGLVKSKIAGGDSSIETAEKLAALDARLKNVGGLLNTVNNFQGE